MGRTGGEHAVRELASFGGERAPQQLAEQLAGREARARALDLRAPLALHLARLLRRLLAVQQHHVLKARHLPQLHAHPYCTPLHQLV